MIPRANWMISLSDLFDILKKEKKRVLFIFLVFMVLGFVSAVIRPIQYTAEGIFKMGSGRETNFLNLDTLFRPGLQVLEEEPQMLLSSWGLLSHLVKQMHLQGHISYPRTASFFGRIWNNLYLEKTFTALKGSERPHSDILIAHELVPGHSMKFVREAPLLFEDLVYRGDIFRNLILRFIDEQYFEVYEGKKRLGEGQLGLPFVLEEGHFTLRRNPRASPCKSKIFPLSLVPLKCVIKSLSSTLSITKDRKNPALLHVRYSSFDPEMAVNIVNGAMRCYQEFLNERTKEKIKHQLAYLNQRKEDSFALLENHMLEHQKYLTQHIHEGGLISLDSESEFIVSQQTELLHRLNEAKAKIERIAGSIYPFVIGHGVLPHESRLHRPSDGPFLVGHDTLAMPCSEPLRLDRDMADSLCSRAVVPRDRLHSFEKFEDLIEAIERDREKLLREATELQPLALHTFEELFSVYIKSIEDYELERKNIEYCLSKINDHEYDTVTLVQICSNSVLLPFIQEVQNLNERLVDNKNFSERERTWTKEQLETKRAILARELEHLKKGKTIQIEVLKQKFKNLEGAFLVLLLDEYKNLKKNLMDMAESQLAFPEKWFREEKLEFNTRMTLKMIEQLVGGIEGKNIAANLVSIESYPFECASFPLLPHHPELFKKGIKTGLVGVAAFLSFLLMGHIYRGPTGSFRNLKGIRAHVLGEIGLKNSFEACDEGERGIFKQLALNLVRSSGESKIVLLGCKKDFSWRPLLGLMKERRERVAFLSLEESEQGSLASYLKEERESPSWEGSELGDNYYFGQAAPFREELLSSKRFIALLEKMGSSYDWIFLSTKSSPLSLEWEILRPFAKKVIFLATEERLHEFSSLLPSALFLVEKRKKEKKFQKVASLLNQEKELYLKEVGPLIDALQERMVSPSSPLKKMITLFRK